MENIQNEQKSLEDLKKIEQENLAYLIKDFYDITISNLFTVAFTAADDSLIKYESPEKIEQYLENLRGIYQSSINFQQGLNKLVQDKKIVDAKYEYFSEEQNRENYNVYNKILDKTIALFEHVKRTENIINNVNDRDNFIRIITKMNKKFETLLNSIVMTSGDLDDFGMGQIEDYVSAYKKFNVFDYPDLYREEVEEKPAVAMVSKSESKISKSETERLDAIDQANQLYDMFVKDFMRDLHNQVSESSYDLYKNFVDVRFANFVKRNPMPLDKTVSIGKAKDVYREINKMIEYVGYISEQSYTISTYPNRGE